jgi:hypothetical protein
MAERPRTQRRWLMLSRNKAVIIGVLILAVAIGLEWAFRFGAAATGCALVENDGVYPIEGLAATYAGTKASLGTLAPGGKTKFWFSGAGRGVLSFEFTQRENPMKGFKVDDFDPAELRSDGSRLVLVVKKNQIERYVEEEETIKTPPRLLERLANWIRDQFR